jgi:hypothetical protein
MSGGSVDSDRTIDIPEGEVRQMNKNTFKKHIPAAQFSHHESREEVRVLDYTPCINS